MSDSPERTITAARAKEIFDTLTLMAGGKPDAAPDPGDRHIPRNDRDKMVTVADMGKSAPEVLLATGVVQTEEEAQEFLAEALIGYYVAWRQGEVPAPQALQAAMQFGMTMGLAASRNKLPNSN